jgi:hypothetical protein
MEEGREHGKKRERKRGKIAKEWSKKSVGKEPSLELMRVENMGRKRREKRGKI